MMLINSINSNQSWKNLSHRGSHTRKRERNTRMTLSRCVLIVVYITRTEEEVILRKFPSHGAKMTISVFCKDS